MRRQLVIVLMMLTFVVVALTGCIPGDGTYSAVHPAGFFWGIWHGWLAPLSLIISLFDHNIRIYEVANIGFLYDLGFYIAIISGFGGISLSRRKKNKKYQER